MTLNQKRKAEWKIGSLNFPELPAGAKCPVCKVRLPNDKHPQAQVEICPECGGLLEAEGKDKLRCPSCGEKFHRGDAIRVWWRVICPEQKFGG